MAEYPVSNWLKTFRTVQLTCRGCQKVTHLGLDDLLAMSKRHDDMTWWRHRFKCGKCGEKNPYFTSVHTHLTPQPETNGAYWDKDSKFGI